MDLFQLNELLFYEVRCYYGGYLDDSSFTTCAILFLQLKFTDPMPYSGSWDANYWETYVCREGRDHKGKIGHTRG
jgi:hypothetical protein